MDEMSDVIESSLFKKGHRLEGSLLNQLSLFPLASRVEEAQDAEPWLPTWYPSNLVSFQYQDLPWVIVKYSHSGCSLTTPGELLQTTA